MFLSVEYMVGRIILLIDELFVSLCTKRDLNV